MVGRDRLAHPFLDRRQVVGRQRSRQQEVVIEAVLDDRADAELRPRKHVEDGFGKDMGGAMAHRAELTGGAVVHQLRGATPFRRLEEDVVVRHLVDLVLLVVSHSVSPENQQTPHPLQDERFDPPAVPPAFAVPCRLRALWPR